MRIDHALHQQYRQRGGNMICDDSHRVATDAGLIASVEDAFVAYDEGETG